MTHAPSKEDTLTTGAGQWASTDPQPEPAPATATGTVVVPSTSMRASAGGLGGELNVLDRWTERPMERRIGGRMTCVQGVRREHLEEHCAPVPKHKPKPDGCQQADLVSPTGNTEEENTQGA